MARVTVEDCIENIPNRFELVGIAAQRAKQISSGDPITVDRDNDKDAVVSLREIADKTIEFDKLREEIVEGYSRYQRPDFVEGIEPPRVVGRAAVIEESDDEIAEEYEEEIVDDSEFDVDAEMPDGMSFDEEDIDVDD